jgi:hypothetical protein
MHIWTKVRVMATMAWLSLTFAASGAEKAALLDKWDTDVRSDRG